MLSGAHKGMEVTHNFGRIERYSRDARRAMNIHEYQAKQLLNEHGIATPQGGVAETPQQAAAIAQELGGGAWMVKAQIHASGRGLGRFRDGPADEGGVQTADSPEAVASITEKMLGQFLVTKQTGSEGQQVQRVYIEQKCAVQQELYLAMFIDPRISRLCLVASHQGGVNIETAVTGAPESLLRIVFDLDVGIEPARIEEVVAGLRLQGRAAEAVAEAIGSMYRLFTAKDASLIEINPLAVTGAGDVLALDAKMTFDDNALFRHQDIAALRDEHELGMGELEARQHGFNYIKLDGNIGCMTCGAGLAMALIDAIIYYGGAPANFLDIPPVGQVDRAKNALKLVLSDPGVESILINVFGGGIMRCDTIADAILLANRESLIEIPLVVRLDGTNAEFAIQRLRDNGPEIMFADNLADAAEKAVAAAAATKRIARQSWWDRVQNLVSKRSA